MKQYVLWGAGEIGHEVVIYLRSKKIEPACFVDTFPWKHGTDETTGIPIYGADEANHKYPEATWVATILSSPASVEIPEAMRQMGVKRDPLWTVLPPATTTSPWRRGPRFGRIPPMSAVEKAADSMSDPKSTGEILRQYHFYAQPDYDVPYNGMLADKDIYFPEFIRQIDHEHFVDCGAYDGDTIRQIITRNWRYEHITAFEADRENFEKLIENDFQNVTLRREAVGDTKGVIPFLQKGNMCSRLSEEGEPLNNATVFCTTIDSYRFTSTPTFIKMDIEGFEKEALWGARCLLRDHAPVLAICAYHDTDDFWQIPHLIHSLQPRYHLFMRRYAPVPWELVCYAVPSERLQ